jgi:hypothetical protein
MLIAAGLDADHACFVVRIDGGVARGDGWTGSHDLARLVRREPTRRPSSVTRPLPERRTR